ncbi:MAG: DoxX family protein [Ferruginibacter sp.]
MKKNNLIYWISTILFAALMIFTSIPDIMLVPEALDFMNKHLGYPVYFILFISYAKVLGCIALFIPGFPRIKEWAYAGLGFDLIGATFSAIAVDGLQFGLSFMLLPFTLGILSYVYYHKKERMKLKMTN